MTMRTSNIWMNDERRFPVLKEFVEKIVTLAEPNVELYDNARWSDKKLYEIRKTIFYPDTMTTQSLTGFVDFINDNVDEIDKSDLMIHVRNYRAVELVGSLDEEGKRERFCIAEFLGKNFGFQFGHWYDSEEFVIHALTNFNDEKGTHLRDVVGIASGLSASSELRTEDDGITQRATVKKGVAIKEDKKLPNPVDLIPKRSFDELSLPIAKFVFRVRCRDGRAPECALFEADGAHWEHQVALLIKKWLTEKVKAIPIIA